MRGLVQVNSHSVLPDVSPGVALACTLVCAAVSLGVVRKSSIWHQVSVSCMSFFLFGWHVHEKAILMVLLPLQYYLIKAFFASFPQVTLPSKLHFQSVPTAANPYMAGTALHNSLHSADP